MLFLIFAACLSALVFLCFLCHSGVVAEPAQLVVEKTGVGHASAAEGITVLTDRASTKLVIRMFIVDPPLNSCFS